MKKYLSLFILLLCPLLLHSGVFTEIVNDTTDKKIFDFNYDGGPNPTETIDQLIFFRLAFNDPYNGTFNGTLTHKGNSFNFSSMGNNTSSPWIVPTDVFDGELLKGNWKFKFESDIGMYIQEWGIDKEQASVRAVIPEPRIYALIAIVSCFGLAIYHRIKY